MQFYRMKNFKKLFNFRTSIIVLMVLISAILLRTDFSKVDDIPHHEVLQEYDVDPSQIMDDNMDDPRIMFQGSSPVMTGVSLSVGQSLVVDFSAYNPNEDKAFIQVDLYEAGFDNPSNEVTCLIMPGLADYRAEITFYRDIHPDSGYLRFFSYDPEGPQMEISNVHITVVNEVLGPHPYVTAACRLMEIIIVLSLAFLLCSLAYCGKAGSLKLPSVNAASAGKHLLPYLGLTVIVTVVLFHLYREADLTYPLGYNGGDECGVYYLVKTIKEYGTLPLNHRAGGTFGADMFDYPYSEKLSFLLVKLISLFVDNVYLITNLFYFLCFYLISYTSYAVCRKLKIDLPESFLVSILFTFASFIQIRYGHLWLVPYFMLPPACLIAFYIVEGDDNTWNAGSDPAIETGVLLFLAFLASSTGLYYAFFSCALFCIAIVVRLLDGGKRNVLRAFSGIQYILACVAGVLVNVLPNILYYLIHGMNGASELTLRNGSDTELYGLKLVQMVIPRLYHRIPWCAELAANYYENYPGVNENWTATMGIVASVGLVLIILNLLSKKKTLLESKFVLSLFLIGTVGGLGTIISLFINLPIRCYNRLSLLIMFLCLLVIARALMALKGKVPAKIICGLAAILTLIGVLDQTVPFKYEPSDYVAFEEYCSFIHSIEDEMEPGDMIYMLPYTNWPSGLGYRNHIGYTESDTLVWSYGAMQAREEANWQQGISKIPAPEMLDSLRRNGYDGLYLDTDLCDTVAGEQQTKKYLRSIKAAEGQADLISENGTVYFWKLNSQN